jgi:PAS domain S-box-containing protein
MEADAQFLDAWITAARKQLDALLCRVDEECSPEDLLPGALAELSATLEELHVASEELHTQNEELLATRHVVEAERQRYADLFEFAPDAYVVTDQQGTIREANAAAALLLGVRTGFLVGKPLDVYVAKDERSSFRARLADLSAGRTQRAEDWQLTLQRRDGTTVPVAITVAAVAPPAPAATTLRWLLRDVSERRRQEETVRALNEQLVRRAADLAVANSEVASLTYAVSHDLRTPLRHIAGFSQALAEDCGDTLDARSRDHLERIRTAATQMSMLIDELQTLSRITQSDLVVGDVPLSALAHTITSELQHAQPDHQATFVIADDVSARGDQRLLRLVLEHLLGNAWKFTARCAAARIEFGTTEDRGEHAYFVRDNGVGFDPSYADKLFVPFQRLHHTDEFPGLGIGLAAVQRIVRRRGGRVWVEGTIGGGADFYFSLPTSGESTATRHDGEPL